MKKMFLISDGEPREFGRVFGDGLAPPFRSPLLALGQRAPLSADSQARNREPLLVALTVCLPGLRPSPVPIRVDPRSGLLGRLDRCASFRAYKRVSPRCLPSSLIHAASLLSSNLPILEHSSTRKGYLADRTVMKGSAMILRDLSATNMGRGAYDTTGVKKPGAPPPPPTTR
ncbi:hypothetical protein VTN49DRAFT_2220 [Thermomyces lanuginosus]|uniref:uncharacterized protein n=1 Tax=Thermomyces lanuginosus TaxID=5541 RepID=UPI00374339C4